MDDVVSIDTLAAVAGVALLAALPVGLPALVAPLGHRPQQPAPARPPARPAGPTR